MFKSLTLCIALLATGCASHRTTIHYRLTVVVDTPQGRRIGSSVLELTSYMSPAIPGPEAGGFRSSVRGEAVPVQLANGKYVFALRRWYCKYPQDVGMILDSFSGGKSREFHNKNELALAVKEISKENGIKIVNPKFYPIIATFQDINKVDTIQYASPDKIGKLIPGLQIVAMTVEIVDAPVTEQLGAIIPWINSWQVGLYDPSAPCQNGDGSLKDDDDIALRFGRPDFRSDNISQ